VAETYRESPETVSGPTLDFLSRLIKEGLVAPADDEDDITAIRPRPIGAENAFSAPLLEKYSDMQELLLLDPIHEVGERGWPEPRVHTSLPANERL